MPEGKQQSVEFSVTAAEARQRLDKYLQNKLPDLSRAAIQKLIRSGDCLVNGNEVSVSFSVSEADLIVIASTSGMKVPEAGLQPKRLNLDIIFEDDDILVLNKPAGLVVHPGAGDTGTTLVEAVLHYLSLSDPGLLPGDEQRPGIVHRLDKDTSGVMVVAKTEAAHNSLARQFHDKTNLREYVALLGGVMQQDLVTFESYLHRDPRNRLRFKSSTMEAYTAGVASGRPLRSWRYAKSFFQKRKTYNDAITLVAVRLATGRTHQIRVHAEAMNMPIVGDQLYGKVKDWRKSFPRDVAITLDACERQMLHARKLGFEHPKTSKLLAFEAPMPGDFRKVLESLENL